MNSYQMLVDNHPVVMQAERLRPSTIGGKMAKEIFCAWVRYRVDRGVRWASWHDAWAEFCTLRAPN